MNRVCRTHAGPCGSDFSGEELESFLLFVVDGHPDHRLSGVLHTEQTHAESNIMPETALSAGGVTVSENEPKNLHQMFSKNMFNSLQRAQKQKEDKQKEKKEKEIKGWKRLGSRR